MLLDEGWLDYASAPPRGTVLCPEENVVEGEVLSILADSDKGSLPLLLTRRGGQVHVFVNACPHQYLPLDYQGSNLLSADGSMLMCASHGARFAIDNGQCVDGPAMGCALDRVPVVVEGGLVRIA